MKIREAIKNKILTQDRVKELFDYKKDGNLVWKKSTNSRIKKGDLAASLNKHFNAYQIGIDKNIFYLHQIVFL